MSKYYSSRFVTKIWLINKQKKGFCQDFQNVGKHYAILHYAQIRHAYILYCIVNIVRL